MNKDRMAIIFKLNTGGLETQFISRWHSAFLSKRDGDGSKLVEAALLKWTISNGKVPFAIIMEEY